MSKDGGFYGIRMITLLLSNSKFYYQKFSGKLIATEVGVVARNKATRGIYGGKSSLA